MEKQKREEELKERIYEAYSEFKETISSDRRQKSNAQLFDLIIRLCRDHLYKETDKINETDEMMEEIYKAVIGLINKDKIPKEKFLEDLGGALYYARKQFYRNQVKGPLKIPRSIKRERKIIRELKEMWESDIGRKLEQDEFVYRYSIWKQISEEKARSTYLENMGITFIDKIGDDDNNITELMDGHSLTMNGVFSSPQDEAMEDSETAIIRDALESVLNKAREKTKPLYKAFFTLRCIETNIKYYRKLWSILDSEILENYWKTLTVPCQYEIYMKYHPEAKKSTAEANASQMSKKLFADLDKAIKEKSGK